MDYFKNVPNETGTPIPVIAASYQIYREIYLTGEIKDRTAAEISAAIRLLDRQSSDDITIYLNTPGGSVSAGLAIYDTFQSVSSDIVTVATGMCCSMGAFLLAGGTPGKRYATPNAEILVHQILGQISGQASDILVHADNIRHKRDHMNRLLAQLTCKTPEQIAEDTDRDNIMSAEEALEYGIIDHIAGPFSEH